MFFGKTRFKDLANKLEKLKLKKESMIIMMLLFSSVFYAQEDHKHNQNNLNQISAHKEIIDKENKDLKNDLKETRLNLEESLEKNRSYEINNFELKNTVSRYINNTKKIQEKLDVTEGSKKLELDQHSYLHCQYHEVHCNCNLSRRNWRSHRRCAPAQA